MKYRIEFETDDPKHAATVLRELATQAEKDCEEEGGDVYNADTRDIIGEWDFGK